VTQAALTAVSPFGQRLRGYLAERFPLIGHGLLIVSYGSSNQFLARALTHPGESMHYGWSSAACALVLLCLFFHLRVFDEHKDFAEDSRNHPQRMLQRGIVTLRELRGLAYVALTLELVVAALHSRAALVAVVIAQAFSLLMLKEFFVGPWLRRHFLLYATSHMLIMPLFALVVFAFATRLPPWEAPGWFVLYAFVGFFVTFNWEVSRKIRSPEDEREGVESYTKIFGTYGAAWVVLGIRVIDTGLVALVGAHLGLAPWFYGALVALFLLCAAGFLQYRLRTSSATAKRMETYAGLYIVAFDLILAVALARHYGFFLGEGA